MAVDTNTKFMNRKRRVIYQSGRSGGYFVKKADGTRYYKPVAAFHTANTGNVVKLTKNHSIPAAIRPARIAALKVKGGPRKVRKNKGMAKGPREGALQRRMNAEAMRLMKKRMAGPKKKKIPLRIFKRSNPFGPLA